MHKSWDFLIKFQHVDVILKVLHHLLVIKMEIAIAKMDLMEKNVIDVILAMVDFLLVIMGVNL